MEGAAALCVKFSAQVSQAHHLHPLLPKLLLEAILSYALSLSHTNTQVDWFKKSAFVLKPERWHHHRSFAKTKKCDVCVLLLFVFLQGALD